MGSHSHSQDDLIDITEMTDKIQSYTHNIVKDNDQHIVMSALMSASISSFMNHCETLEEVAHFGAIFVSLLDDAIRNVLIDEEESPFH